MVRALIVGKGDMALGLCRQFGSHNGSLLTANDEESGVQPKPKHSLYVTSSSVEVAGVSFQDTGVPFVDMAEGLECCDVIILAIPSAAIHSFLSRNIEAIKDKIIVDITNPAKKGENVRSALEDIYKCHGVGYDVHWVKAFNDVGALDLITRKATSKKALTTTMCGNDAQAVDTVKVFAQQALAFERVTILPQADFASEMEESQGSIGWEWIHTFWIMLFIHAASFAYIAVRVHKGFGTPKDSMPVSTFEDLRPEFYSIFVSHPLFLSHYATLSHTP